MTTTRVDHEGKAKVGRRKLEFPLTLAGAVITIPDDEDDSEE